MHATLRLKLYYLWDKDRELELHAYSNRGSIFLFINSSGRTISLGLK